MMHTESHTLRPDAKGRITLGKLAEGVSSYRVIKEAGGRLILEPYAEIPAGEKWLFDNAQALEQVRKGLFDAARGRVSERGDFTQYLNEPLD